MAFSITAVLGSIVNKKRSKPAHAPVPVKVIDEEMEIRCCNGWGKIREEVWQDAEGKVVRYNLAFIHHLICARDNGRVLGYDTAHGHHRHFMGAVEKFDFVNYEDLSTRFFDEVAEICKEG